MKESLTTEFPKIEYNSTLSVDTQSDSMDCHGNATKPSAAASFEFVSRIETLT